MNSPFDSLLNSLQTETSESKLKQQFKTEIKRFQHSITAYVSERWLRGESVFGGSIGSYVFEKYATYKNKINPTPGLGNYDLTLTGRLRDGLFLEEGNDIFTVKSSDWKYKAIINGELRWSVSESEFGLLDNEKKEVLDDISGIVYENIINKTYGK